MLTNFGKMIIKRKFNFYQIYKIIFLLFLTNTSNLYAHNIVNGGCKLHCEHKVNSIKNRKKLKNIDHGINYEIKNSCLNKSLCRGWFLEILDIFMQFYLWQLSNNSYLLDNFY